VVRVVLGWLTILHLPVERRECFAAFALPKS